VSLAGILVSGLCAASAQAADATAPAQLAEAEKTWNLSFDSDFRVVSWRSTRGFPTRFTDGLPGRGSQIYAPGSATFTWQATPDIKVEILARSGYISARQRSGGGLAGSIATPSDTSLTGTVTYTGLGAFQPFVSLAANLPTGKTRLTGTKAYTRMDSDLVEVASYGEGRNIGPTVGFNYAFSDVTMLTASAGYTRRGAFWRDSVLGIGNPDSYMQPSDSVTHNLQLVHGVGAFTFTLAGMYTISGKSKLDGVFSSRSGSTLGINGSVAYAWNDAHKSTVSLSWSETKKNFILDPVFGSIFIKEAQNSNSDTVRIGFEHSYRFNDQLTIGANTSWFQRDKNSYSDTDGSFTPAKSKVTLGAFGRYQVNNAFVINAKVEHFRVVENIKPDVDVPGFGVIADTGIPKIKSHGLLMSLGATANF
jgi:outer membrane protein W